MDEPEKRRNSITARMAVVRFGLCIATIVIILVDGTVPNSDSSAALLIALTVGLAFLLYAWLVWVAVRQNWLSTEQYEKFTPLADVVMSTLLILSTDGYMSPFNLWLVLSVVSTGLHSAPRMPYVTTFAAVIAHLTIATVPQYQPLAPATFLVRTTYLFGFAAMMAILGNDRARRTEILTLLDAAGERFAGTMEVGEAAEVLLDILRSSLRVKMAKISLDPEGKFAIGEQIGEFQLRLDLASGQFKLGELEVWSAQPLTSHDEQLLQLLAERFSSTVRRIRSTEEAVRASAREERYRVRDELHDGLIQTLTGINLRLKGLETSPNALDRRVSGEIKEARELATVATLQARELLEVETDRVPTGPEVLRNLISIRWPGEWSCLIAPEVELTDGQWRLIEGLLREGLNNASRHGEASRITFRLYSQPGEVCAALEADGRSPSEPIKFGYGLHRLAMIAKEHHGELHFEPLEDGGSVLFVIFRRNYR